MTTHYMDEAEYCDRIAIMDNGRIIALDTPAALKASIGKDRVQLRTADDDAAIEALGDRFGLDAAIHEGAVTQLVVLSFTLTAFGVLAASRIKSFQGFMALVNMIMMPMLSCPAPCLRWPACPSGCRA